MKKHETYTFVDEDYYYPYDEFEELREEIALNKECDIADVSDDNVYDEIRFYNDCDWEEFGYNLEKFLSHNTLIAFMDIGCWDGRFGGFAFIDNFLDFTNLLQDRNTIYLEDGELIIKAIHHDGINYYRLKALTNAGKKLARMTGFKDYTSNTFDNNIRTRHIKLEELVG